MTGTIDKTYQLNWSNSMNLTPKEAAERLRLSTGTLSNWRVRGDGPSFIKLGSKVLYPLAEVEAYEKRQLRRNTTGAAA